MCAAANVVPTIGLPSARLTTLQVGQGSVPFAPWTLIPLGLLKAAKRPVFIVGHGARFDMAAVVELAEHLGAPVLTTFKAKGLISDDHPLAAGVLGRSGTPVASWLMNESDLLLVFGASFSNHTGITPYKPIVQVDFDPMALGRSTR